MEMTPEVRAAFNLWKSFNDLVNAKDWVYNKRLVSQHESAAKALFEAAGFKEGTELLHTVENARYRVSFITCQGAIRCRKYTKAKKIAKAYWFPWDRCIYAREFLQLEQV